MSARHLLAALAVVAMSAAAQPDLAALERQVADTERAFARRDRKSVV